MLLLGLTPESAPQPEHHGSHHRENGRADRLHDECGRHQLEVQSLADTESPTVNASTNASNVHTMNSRLSTLATSRSRRRAATMATASTRAPTAFSTNSRPSTPPTPLRTR